MGCGERVERQREAILAYHREDYINNITILDWTPLHYLY